MDRIDSSEMKFLQSSFHIRLVGEQVGLILCLKSLSGTDDKASKIAHRDNGVAKYRNKMGS